MTSDAEPAASRRAAQRPSGGSAASENESEDALDDFFSMAAHELRSPLNAIRGWAHVLRSAGPLTAQQQRALDAIDRGVATQARQIDDLLDHRRLERGLVKLQLQALLLEPLIDDVVDSLRAVADGKQLVLAVRHAGKASALRADSARLRQAFEKLLAHAVRFSAGGRLQISSRAHGDWLVVEVSDGLSEGTGGALGAAGSGPDAGAGTPLPASADAQRPHRAALGLSLARRIVEMHGGRFGTPGDPAGRGPNFTIELSAG